jgi:hypothetical protein
MDIPMILSKRYEGAEWSLSGDSYSGLTWLSEDITQPSLADLEAVWAEVQFEVAYEAVQKQRQAKYQTESDPVFFDYQRGEVTEQDWLDAVEAVKVALPYPVLEDFLPEPEPEILAEVVEAPVEEV